MDDFEEELKAQINKSERRDFMAMAKADKLKKLEKEQLRQAMIEGYQARQSEDAEVNREWQGATMKEWPQ
jgi:hypothetical protein